MRSAPLCDLRPDWKGEVSPVYFQTCPDLNVMNSQKALDIGKELW
jgi:hypothetical protein